MEVQIPCSRTGPYGGDYAKFFLACLGVPPNPRNLMDVHLSMFQDRASIRGDVAQFLLVQFWGFKACCGGCLGPDSDLGPMAHKYDAKNSVKRVQVPEASAGTVVERWCGIPLGWRLKQW